MNLLRVTGLVALVFFGGFILWRERTWLEHATLISAVAVDFALFLWLARKWWRWQTASGIWPTWKLAGAIMVTSAAVVLEQPVFLAVAWTLFLLAFLEVCTVNRARRLALLPFLGFPWLVTDGLGVNRALCISGAAIIDWVLFALGIIVQRNGAFVDMEGTPLTLEITNSGFEALQPMVVAGFILILLKVPPGVRFWCASTLLFPLAWVVAMIRIVSLATLTLTYGADLGASWFLQWGSWLAVCLMMVLSHGFFAWIATFSLSPSKSVRWT